MPYLNDVWTEKLIKNNVFILYLAILALSLQINYGIFDKNGLLVELLWLVIL